MIKQKLSSEGTVIVDGKVATSRLNAAPIQEASVLLLVLENENQDTDKTRYEKRIRNLELICARSQLALGELNFLQDILTKMHLYKRYIFFI